MDSMSLYAKIQTLVQNEARQIATETYNELGTQYDVARVPAHAHNGVDSNRLEYKDIVQGNKYTTGIVEDTTETITIGGIYNPTRIIFSGFAANNATTAYTVTIPFVGGETAATLTTNWTRTSGIYPVTFSDGEIRYVTFTIGSTAITWSNALLTSATVNISVGANKRAIINGEINFGTCFDFSDLVPPFVLNTSGAGQPFLQFTNSMYIDSNDLTHNRVSSTEGVTNDATSFFLYSSDETGATFASGRATSYNNQLGLLTLDLVVGADVKIQGALTIT